MPMWDIPLIYIIEFVLILCLLFWLDQIEKFLYILINTELTQTFSSIAELSRYLKGDRTTIRNYLNGNSSGLYRGQ